MTYIFTFFMITLAISFGDRLGQSLQRPCEDRTETTQSSCNLHDLRTKIAQCLWDVLAGSRRLSQEPTIICPNDYLKSSVVLTISLWGIVQSTCDVSTGYYWLAIFQKLSECRVYIEATLPMNHNDDRTVSWRWLHGKGDLYFVPAS